MVGLNIYVGKVGCFFWGTTMLFVVTTVPNWFSLQVYQVTLQVTWVQGGVGVGGIFGVLVFLVWVVFNFTR